MTGIAASPPDTGRNFAAELVRRLGAGAQLIDAPSGRVLSGGPAISGAVHSASGTFQRAGIRPGDRIVLGCDISSASLIAYLGAISAGLVVAPVDRPTFRQRGLDICRTLDAAAVWSADRNDFSAWRSANGVTVIETEFAGGPGEPVHRNPDDLAALMATSGSTGLPGFVKVTHGNLLANTEAIAGSQGLTAEDRALLVLPISYCFGASVVHSHLWCGGSVIFEKRMMFPKRVMESVGKFGCTTFAGVPFAFKSLLLHGDLTEFCLPDFRRFLQAGGALPVADIERFMSLVPAASFFTMYGQTEATARISSFDVREAAGKIGSVGKPVKKILVEILDEEQRPVATGLSGEVCVRGASVTSGYWDETDNQGRWTADGMLRTGDIGRVDDDGYLWIQGRVSNFMKVKGHRIAFEEIETRVLSVDGVAEAAAYSIPHSDFGEVPGIVVVSEKKPDDDETVLEAIRKILDPSWICDSVTVVESLPRTSSGKLARSELSELEGRSCLHRRQH